MWPLNNEFGGAKHLDVLSVMVGAVKNIKVSDQHLISWYGNGSYMYNDFRYTLLGVWDSWADTARSQKHFDLPGFSLTWGSFGTTCRGNFFGNGHIILVLKGCAQVACNL